MTPAEHLAKLFHETYEALAPQYGYETRKETAVPWEELPEANRLLMTATCNAILEDEAMPRARIAALEAQVEAAHRAIDSIGLSRCADAHAGVYPDGRITCDDGRPPLSLVERTEWLIRWLSDDPYPMGPRIKALEAENAALKAELSKLETGWIDLQRSDAGQLAAARQSRARLVRLVRALRNEVRNHKLVNEMCEDDLADVQDQRDSAEAWAAAWKRAAKWWRDYGAAWWLHNGSSNRTKATASFRTISMMRRPLNRAMGLNRIGPNEESDAARRAAEAAEAQERR